MVGLSCKTGIDLLKLKEEISRVGWHYFYMGAIDQTVPGRDRTKCILGALKGLTAKMQLKNCNSIQIDDVLTHSFLGIPYGEGVCPLLPDTRKLPICRDKRAMIGQASHRARRNPGRRRRA